MLSESSKKLILYKLIDISSNEEIDFVYLTEIEANDKNNAYLLNKTNRRYVVVNPKKKKTPNK